MNDAYVYGSIGLLFGGQLVWKLAVNGMTGWLKEHDPTYELPGIGSKLLIGGLFTSFGLVGRYATGRAAKNEAATLVWVFWGGLGVSLLGMVLLIGGLASL